MDEKLFMHKDCPTAGTGCHNWLYYMAKQMQKHGIDDEVAAPYIEARMSRAPSPAMEVEHALAAAKGDSVSTTPKWKPRCFKLIQEIMRKPIPAWYPRPVNAEEAIDRLFPGNPLLCVGQASYKFRTRNREDLRGSLGTTQLIVPSPMTAIRGYTQQGHRDRAAGKFAKPSEHTLENTGPRHYLITEWDWGTADNHLRFIRHLSQFWPLACVVHSGGKSTHGWFDTRGEDEDKVKEFFNFATEVGADPRLWLRSQFCRMPGGLRDNGNRQEILYIK